MIIMPAENPSPSSASASSLTVGTRVHVRNGNGNEGESGTIIEDFGRHTTAVPAHGNSPRSLPPLRRWGIALDDGRLVFADSAQLEADRQRIPPPKRTPPAK